ncbi:hypothetical protein N7540_006552 [Penicillium herquei]|nr:hypothetical protein N7540_006552 [Penicillium herquei]
MSRVKKAVISSTTGNMSSMLRTPGTKL